MKSNVKVFIPGRVEIIGNHTDHQRGKVISAPINLGTQVIAKKNDSDILYLESKGHGYIRVKTSKLKIVENTLSKNSTKMIIGILQELKNMHYNVSGANLYIKSTLPTGIGLGSSASFCLAIIESLNRLNNYRIKKLDLANICQRIEHIYINKDSGLMDQITCLSSNPVFIDFKNKDHPLIESINLKLNESKHCICIINCNSKHDDFIKDYNEIKMEMEQVAKYFSKDSLREITLNDILEHVNEIRKNVSDRAWLRSFHYIKENNRADTVYKITKKSNYDVEEVLKKIKESNESSKNSLQNYVSPTSNDMSLTIQSNIINDFLCDSAVIKICGGGFGGALLVIASKSQIDMLSSKFNDNLIKIELLNKIRDKDNVL